MLTEKQRRFGHDAFDPEARSRRNTAFAKAREAKLDNAWLSTVISERSKMLESVDARLRRAWRIHELTKEKRPCST